ncbi:MAG: ATP synthase F0 subunit A [Bacteroides sp. 43_108]|nr:MAG: ATP synthase F0 subunit A [Bacteroides sp. 43_108]
MITTGFKTLVCTVFAWLAFLCSSYAADGPSADKQEPLDLQSIILEHISDSYEWHITKIGDTELVIPLPVILYSELSGFHVMMSSSFVYDPASGCKTTGDGRFMIMSGGDYDGKIVEKCPDGSVRRPMVDISITKNVAALLINSIILVLVILGVSRWYRGRKASDPAPNGFVGLMEMFVMMVEDDVIKGCIGERYKRYSPYLLTVFFFIFVNNLMGLVPIFPGGANVTGNIAVTFVLAMITFIVVNVTGSRHYWKDIFWPEVPLMLKCPVPLMPLIEFVGIFTKPFSLMVRLFANMMAGHAVILSLVCIIFITSQIGPGLCAGMTVMSILFSVFMNMLELLVAFIQAYVFTMLSAVFIGLSNADE